MQNFCYQTEFIFVSGVSIQIFNLFPLPGIQSLPINLEHHSGLVQHHAAELINFLQLFEDFFLINWRLHFATFFFNFSFLVSLNYLPIISSSRVKIIKRTFPATFPQNEGNSSIITRCHQEYHFWFILHLIFPALRGEERLSSLARLFLVIPCCFACAKDS